MIVGSHSNNSMIVSEFNDRRSPNINFSRKITSVSTNVSRPTFGESTWQIEGRALHHMAIELRESGSHINMAQNLSRPKLKSQKPPTSLKNNFLLMAWWMLMPYIYISSSNPTLLLEQSHPDNPVIPPLKSINSK